MAKSLLLKKSIGFIIFVCLLCGVMQFMLLMSRTTFAASPRDWHNSLRVYLSRISPLHSPDSSFFPPPIHESRNLFLQSCNLSFARDACSVLRFQPSMDVASRRKKCLWGRLDADAGLGHQMTEMLFYAQLAHIYMLPHVFEPFSSAKSVHSSSYDWAVDFFGLEHTFQSLGSKIAKSVSMTDEPMDSCAHYLRPCSTQCDDSMTRSIDFFSEFSSNCFKSPLMHKLFANFAPCFRQSSLCYGNWTAQAKFVPYDPSVINIAWHIRVGDENHYNSSSVYFRQVLCFISPVAHHSS